MGYDVKRALCSRISFLAGYMCGMTEGIAEALGKDHEEIKERVSMAARELNMRIGKLCEMEDEQ